MTCSSTFDDAQKLVAKYGTRDPFQIICEAPDIKLWSTNSFAANGLKGFATIQNRTKYVVVNALLEKEEQRVVAGHELAHIIRHESRLRTCLMKDFNIYGAVGKLEREANFFAADLLIGDDEALDEIQSCGADFFSVAKTLCIPAPFFAFKLYSMVERGHPVRVPVELNNSFLAETRDTTDAQNIS